MNKTSSSLGQKLQGLRASTLERLSSERFFVVVDNGDESTQLLDSTTGLRYQYPNPLMEFIRREEFIYLSDTSDKTMEVLLQAKNRLLWYLGFSVNDGTRYRKIDAEDRVTENELSGLVGWQLPNVEQLKTFCKASGNPIRAGSEYRLKNGASNADYWLTSEGCFDVAKTIFSLTVAPDLSGGLLPVNETFSKYSDEELIVELTRLNVELVSADSKTRIRSPEIVREWQNKSLQEIADFCIGEERQLLTLDSSSVQEPSKSAALSSVQELIRSIALSYLENLDYRPSRLPKIERHQLYDLNKGLWELWGEPEDTLAALGVRARDPVHDLRSSPVAIDFGTSSTVVAVQEGTRAVLLRIGAKDYYAPLHPKEFENPTVIELLDYQKFFHEWCSTAYRPEHDWDWLRMGHEARASWDANSGDTAVLGSILPRLKGWAMRDADLSPLRLIDRNNGKEITIPPLAERTVVRGQQLSVNPSDPFDPIEFYAYQLGMAINWRGRGLYLEYYLSFPAKYDKATKAKIRASFARGLQRSLPPTLVDRSPPVSG